VNVRQTAMLLEALRLCAPTLPMVYVATDKSFGAQQNCGLDAPYLAVAPYDASKACEDIWVETYCQTYGLPVALVRFPNFVGEGDFNSGRLVPSLCRAALLDHEFSVRTKLTGSTRQYIYVRDAANIVATTLEALSAGEAVWPRSHFGPPHIKSVSEVVASVEALSGRRLRVRELNQPGETSHLSLMDQNGLSPKYTEWSEAVEVTWRWSQAQVAR
jgi:nucleoside-diphosphate-sugar epimerase